MSDPEPITTGCEEWPVVWPCDIEGRSEEELEQARQFAVQILWAYAGRSLGACVYSEGYYPPGGGCYGPWKDASGEWRNRAAHDCCRILLAEQPVLDIVSVVLPLEGRTLDPAEYVNDHGYLRRRGMCWPSGAECDDPPVVVTYTAGFPLPLITGNAVGEVACEVLVALGGGQCKLPSRAISITRQGVTVQLANPDDLNARNRLGLALADLWLALVNPGGLQVRSRVYSPDLARRGA